MKLTEKERYEDLNNSRYISNQSNLIKNEKN